MDDGQAGPSGIKRKCPPDDFVDDDNDMNRESQYKKRNGTASLSKIYFLIDFSSNMIVQLVNIF